MASRRGSLHDLSRPPPQMEEWIGANREVEVTGTFEYARMEDDVHRSLKRRFGSVEARTAWRACTKPPGTGRGAACRLRTGPTRRRSGRTLASPVDRTHTKAGESRAV